MKKIIRRVLVLALLTIGAIGIFAIGVHVGYQHAYRNEHHLFQALLLDRNQELVEEDVEGFLINQFYYSGLLCPKRYAQGVFRDHGASSSRAPKGKRFDVGSNQELYEEYMRRANNH